MFCARLKDVMLLLVVHAVAFIAISKLSICMMIAIIINIGVGVGVGVMLIIKIIILQYDNIVMVTASMVYHILTVTVLLLALFLEKYLIFTFFFKRT